MESYNSLIILETFKKNKRKYALVRCVCGNEKICNYSSVKSGLTKSCGCLRSKNTIELNKNKNVKDKYINQIYKTNEGYEVKIIDYRTNHDVTVEFQTKEHYTTKTTIQNIKKGQIKNVYHRSVYGLGYFGEGEYTARLNNVKTLAYIKWNSMFTRCYNEDFQEKNAHYRGCSVDESFYNFQDFAKWINENIYEYDETLELDKDILKEGNKVYGKDTCCLVPKEVNNAVMYKKGDKEYMTKIYNKYENILPVKVKEAFKRFL